MAEPLVRIVEFTLHYDKYRGILLEKFSTDNNEYFFKHHDQPIHRHCEQMKRIVQTADVKRSKKIRVDIAEFIYEYFRNNTATFKGCPLKSVNGQIEKVSQLYINKEIAAMKRSATVAQNKQLKILAHNSKLLMKMEEADNYFQVERARRINELFSEGNSGLSRGPTPPGTTQGPGTLNGISPLTPPSTSRVAAVVPQVRILPPNSETQDDDDPMNHGLSDDEF